MFEKEAKEYARYNCQPCLYDDLPFFIHTDDSRAREQSFKDGAEFGFNKAKEEDKWHFVKDELPISDKDKYYFVVDKWNEPMIARFYEGVWSNYSTIEDVIAWKEIVLPKEIKENDR